MADLRFPRSELAEYFCHRARFDAAGEEGVELFGASGDGDELGPALVHFRSSGEAHGDKLGGCRVEEWISEVVKYSKGRWGGPSARTLVAFCSEIPLICSRTLRGLFNLSHCPSCQISNQPTYRPPTRQY